MARKRLWYYDSKTSHTEIKEGAKTLPCGAFRHSHNMKKASFPEGFEALPKDCFLGCPKLKHIELPSVADLGERACALCPSLESLYLPDGPEVLPRSFLEEAKSLSLLRLPETLRKIEALALKNAQSLTDLHLPEKLEYLGKSALSGCDKLERLFLPKNLKTLQAFALPYGALAEISVCEGNQTFKTKDNVLFSHDEKVLILYPSADKRKVYHVPEGIEVLGVGAFYKNKYLERLILPKSLKKISRTALGSMASLKELVFNSAPLVAGAKEPLFGAISNCPNLHDITLPNWQGIPPYTFALSKLARVNFSEGLEVIARGAFYLCPLREVHLPKSVRKLADGAFYGTKHLIFSQLEKGYYTGVAGLDPTKKEDWSPHILEIAGNGVWLGGGNHDIWQDLLNEIDWDGEAFGLSLADQGFDTIENENDKRLWVINRLKSPQTIHDRMLKRYIGYLKRDYLGLLFYLMEEKDELALRLVFKLVPPKKEEVDLLLKETKAKGLSELMPELLSYGGKKRSFSL